MAYGGRRGGVDNPDVLYVAFGSTVMVRTTAGGNLTATGTAFPGGSVADIELDPTDWQHAVVIDSNSVYETTDAGATWNDRTGDLSNSQLRTVEYYDGGTTDVFAVGGQGGVFRMITNNPDHWTEFGDLPNAVTFDLEYNAADDVLLAGTFGRGAWTVGSASTVLAVPGVLQIDGDTDFPARTTPSGLCATHSTRPFSTSSSTIRRRRRTTASRWGRSSKST